jgi:putative tryptophan/tyrosine transport system substrate-binding protein
MRRRGFMALLGGAAAWPLTARAQQQPMPVIGFLHLTSLEEVGNLMPAIRRGLNETGYVEDRNVTIAYRLAEGRRDRLPELAADLVHRQVKVIFASAIDAALAAKSATSTIPIVFATANDPVQFGLVASLSRPGGNATGVSFLLAALGEKRLALLHDLVPAAGVVAVLVNPNNANVERNIDDLQAAARALRLRIQVMNAATEPDLEGAFASLEDHPAHALMVLNDPVLLAMRGRIVSLAAHFAIPAMYSTRGFIDAGGLMSYGPDVPDAYRQAAVYAGRMLHGARAADLPVLQSTKFELVINLRTAKTLSLKVPPSLIALADEVIE